MDLLHVALTTLFSIAVLFAVTRMLGYRQTSQLSMFDYANGITIGSIAAELAVARGEEFWEWTIALVIYGAVTTLLSLLTDRLIRVRRALNGTPVFLMKKGVLYDQNFKHARLDLNEFQMILRGSGYFNLDELDTVIFEPNGRLSVLPKTENRPATPQDLSTTVFQEEVSVNLIMDGQVLSDNLRACGRDMRWLEKELKTQKVQLTEVFLGCWTQSGGLTVYKRGGKLTDRTFE